MLFTKEWDYSALAKTYDKRVDYADTALDFIYEISKLPTNTLIADIGAGTAKLSKLLLMRGAEIHAVEPNDEMQKIGIQNTKNKNIKWITANSHDTTLPSCTYQLVTFGSSFNVADRGLTLKETKRILKPKGWFACLWNHRDLNDSLQLEIEKILKKFIPSYNYGVRRENQSDFLENSGFFSEVVYGWFPTTVSVNVDDFYAAWESHGTLAKEAKELRGMILEKIKETLKGTDVIQVPYATRVWIGQLR
jgi:ubiquinone/menaquinone biosynthesis C-methylase UbiE